MCGFSVDPTHCINTMDVQAVGRPIHDSCCRIIFFYCIDCVFGIFVVLKNEVVANQLLASFWMVVQGNLTVLYLCNVHLSLFFLFLVIHSWLLDSQPSTGIMKVHGSTEGPDASLSVHKYSFLSVSFKVHFL